MPAKRKPLPAPLDDLWLARLQHEHWSNAYETVVRSELRRFLEQVGDVDPVAAKTALARHLCTLDATRRGRLIAGIGLLWPHLITPDLNDRPSPQASSPSSRGSSHDDNENLSMPSQWKSALSSALRPRRRRRGQESERQISRREHAALMTRLNHFIRISGFDEANERIETAVRRWSQGVADLTIAEISKATYVSQLFRALRIVEPGKDWRWLDEDARRWKRASKASPGRKCKHMRYTSTAMLRELSRQLIDDAEMSRPSAAAAVRYRDGLVIGLLARRPIRLRNLANLRLNESLRLLDGEWWITLQEGETKNGDGLSFRIDDLSYEIERWLQNWRPYLTPTDPQHLWPSHISGLPLTSGALSRHIGDVTEKYLGKRLTPHFFRDALMTDLASTGEEFAVRAGSHVLGHRSAASADAYIVRAISEQATSKLDMIIGQR